jgi:hypothetical protein
MMGWFEDYFSPPQVAGFLSGGVSDIFQGKNQGSTQYESFQKLFGGNQWGRTVGSLADPFGSTLTELDSAHGIPEAIDAVADPTHSVNWSLEEIGTYLPQSIRDIAPALGATIGTMVYPVAGTAAGYGIGAHIAGKSSQDAQMGAGIGATTAYATQGLGDLFGSSNAGGDALGGGLTAEEAALAGAEYGYNTAGEGVGTIVQSGYPTGSEAASFYALDEFATPTTVNAQGVPQNNISTEQLVSNSPEPSKVSEVPKSSWTDKVISAAKSPKALEILGKLGKALSQSGGELVAGNANPEGGASMDILGYDERERARSEVGSSKASNTNLSMWETEEQKKKRYNLDMTVNYLTNYNGKKKEETNNGYLR